MTTEVPDVKPISSSCEATLTDPPERIAEQRLDLDHWPGLEGYGSPWTR